MLKADLWLGALPVCAHLATNLHSFVASDALAALVV
jgi:hypothetical protein